MKTIKILFLFVGMLLSGATNAQTFKESDLDGQWKRSEGMIVDIKGTTTFVKGCDALIINVGI